MPLNFLLTDVRREFLPYLVFLSSKLDQLREREKENFNSVAFRAYVLTTQTEFDRKESSDCNSTLKFRKVCLKGEDSVFCNWISQVVLCGRMNRGFGLDFC
ncbi:hypothetical protein CEXT_663141 [Caerostris extrusa]|uniref:Uncharacterized protein n=1 Tax=Caerostris extrusa TaxID=172846 RepID=A0AAV4YAH4_CAEEX|nr:hypothetical protein CEXT_663141 [Caerostris extrusa]